MAARKLARTTATLWRWYVHRKLRTPLAVAQRRVATAVGAVLLAVFALAFARSADEAQLIFRRIIAVAPWAPLILTPTMFGAVAFATSRWAREARGSGIPQIIAAAERPESAELNAPGQPQDRHFEAFSDTVDASWRCISRP